jgi:hypothetical protein
MKNIFLLFLLLILILSACSPAPAPVVNATGYEALQIDDVQVEVGVGSPIPVHVNLSGSLPDTCSQVEYAEIKQDGSNFMIKLSTIPGSGEDCVKDGLPFRMSIPLNVIGLPAGDYSVDVNGAVAGFTLETGITAASLPSTDSEITRDDIQVDSVNVDVGVGSPIPVKAIVSLNLPNSCAQLGEIRLHRDGTAFFVRLIAGIPQGENCQADSIPFRLEIPLNIVNLPEGPYVVNVNGATASFDPRAVPASQSLPVQ